MKEHAKQIRRAMIVDDFSPIDPQYWTKRLGELSPKYPDAVGYQKNGFNEFILNLLRDKSLNFYNEILPGIRIEDEPESSEESIQELN